MGKIILVVIEALIAIGVKTVFSACPAMENGMYMSCHNAENAVFILAIVQALLIAASYVLKNKKVRIALGALFVVSTIASLIIPGNVIHLCMMASMRCHSVFKVFNISANVAGLIVFAVVTVLEFKKERNSVSGTRVSE